MPRLAFAILCFAFATVALAICHSPFGFAIHRLPVAMFSWYLPCVRLTFATLRSTFALGAPHVCHSALDFCFKRLGCIAVMRIIDTHEQRYTIIIRS